MFNVNSGKWVWDNITGDWPLQGDWEGFHEKLSEVKWFSTGTIPRTHGHCKIQGCFWLLQCLGPLLSGTLYTLQGANSPTRRSTCATQNASVAPMRNNVSYPTRAGLASLLPSWAFSLRPSNTCVSASLLYSFPSGLFTECLLTLYSFPKWTYKVLEFGGSSPSTPMPLGQNRGV